LNEDGTMLDCDHVARRGSGGAYFGRSRQQFEIAIKHAIIELNRERQRQVRHDRRRAA